MEKERLAWMDMAKGFGILIVLMNHAELNLGPVNWLGGMFYMPVFFVMAGMTFSMRQEETMLKFASRKAKRLLVPYFACSLFLFLFFFCKDSLLSGQVSKDSFFPLLGILYSRNCLYPLTAGANVQLMTILNAPSWFLTCLFLALLFFAGVWKLGEKNKKAACGMGLLLMLAGLLLHYVSPVLLPWSLECALYATVFLWAGYGIRKYRITEWVYEKKWPALPLALLFVGAAWLNGPVNMSVGSYGASLLLYALVGTAGSLLCLAGAYALEKRNIAAAACAGSAAGRQTLRLLCLHLFVFMLVKTAAGYLPYIGTDGPFLKIWMILASFLLLAPGSLQKKTEILLWGLLFTWYLPIINKGIDVQDTCFYLANYRYVFTPAIQVNELYYLLGEVLGGVIYHLFPGHELLALNGACAAVYTATALLIYGRLKREMPKIPLLLCILAGSMFAITWVHCVNWNAWSVLFVTAGAWLLLCGISAESAKLIGAAGFLLGLNAFVRMPNILFLALAAVVFWNFWTKKGWGDGLRACLPMAAGGVLAGIAGIGISLGLLGADKFTEDFRVLTELGAEGDLHSVTTGIYQFLVGLKDGLFVWLKYSPILLAEVLVFKVWKKHAEPGEKRERYMLMVAVFIAASVGFIKGWEEDILRIQVFTALAGIVVPGIAAWYYRKRDLPFSCLCLTAMIIEGFLTIGTDTAAIYYRVYMGLPLAMAVCILGKWSRGRKEWSVVSAFAIAFVLSGAARYADSYIYHDGPKEELTAAVDNPVFTGVYTTRERAESLNRLQEQLAPYEDYELITIGNFTAAQAMTDMKPFFRSSWPDLDYLVDSLFEETLREKLAEGIYPVVVIATEEVNGPYWMPEKVEILEGLVAKEPYEKIYGDHLYSLYVPERPGLPQ